MIKTPKFWQSKNIISISLWPLSLLYWTISSIKSYFESQKKIDTKIICIGNAIAGGAGKTPSSIMVGKILKERGYKIAYACKNYLSTIKNPTKVSSSHCPPEVVEESILLSKIADTFVAKNIIDAVSAANKGSYDYIITDDGLQNNKFYKDISILVIDGTIGVGNNMMLPAGPLREPLKHALKKVNAIFMIGEDKCSISSQVQGKSIITLLPQFKILRTKKTIEKYLAFTGIAYPQKFFESLKKNNITMKDKIEFPDHHLYNEKEIDNLVKQANNMNSRLITTEKDLIKIPKQYHKDITCLVIELEPEKQKSILDIL
ncbi:MAG: tetraacyldisaccharide 4'-kinase [Alphaproteobacteria bacterium]|nr:tetraacyldisaccharide 4'-kinase [Alphaproteobacteria bacterium]